MSASRSLALCSYYLGAADYLRGRFDSAMTRLTEAAERYRGVNAAAGEAVALQFMGMAATALGDATRGQQLIEQGIIVARQGAMPSHTLIRLHAALGRNRLDANDLPAALAATRAGLALVDLHANCICNTSIYCVGTVAMALTGDLATASRFAREATSRAESLNSDFFRTLAGQAEAMVHAMGGAWDESFASLDRALAAAQTGGFPYEHGRVLLLRAFVHTRRHGVRDVAAAASSMRAAVPYFARLGARASLGQARSSLRFMREHAAQRT